MRKGLFLCFYSFFVRYIAIQRIILRRSAADTLDTFASDRSVPMVVSVGNFTYADKKVGSCFFRYFEDELSAAIIRNPVFELFARDSLDEILEIAELSLTDLFDQSTVMQVGSLKGIEGIFSGRFFDNEEDVRVFLELVDIESGILLKKAEPALPRSAIPVSLSIRPDNYNNAMFVLDEFSEVQNVVNRDFIIKAWTPRGDGGVYREGEQLVINFYANRDCFIKLYHIDVNKKMKLIVPNQFYPNKTGFEERRYTKYPTALIRLPLI